MADELQAQPNDTAQPAPTTPPAQEPTPGGNADTKSFTQAELDKMFADRAKQAKQAVQADLLKALGVDDLDALKTLLKEAVSLKESQMSAAEKLQAEAEKSAKRAVELEAQLNAERQAARELARDTAIKDAAKGVENPGDVVVWAQANATEQLAKTLKDDGTVDDGAVKALVEACRKARPNWFTAGGPGSPSNNGGRVPNVNENRKKALDAMPKIRL